MMLLRVDTQNNPGLSPAFARGPGNLAKGADMRDTKPTLPHCLLLPESVKHLLSRQLVPALCRLRGRRSSSGDIARRAERAVCSLQAEGSVWGCEWSVRGPAFRGLLRLCTGMLRPWHL